MWAVKMQQLTDFLNLQSELEQFETKKYCRLFTG